MSNTYQISPNNRLLSQALKREQYELMSPLARTIALSNDARTYFNAPGADWYALKGIDRLCAVSISGNSLYSLNAVESLVSYFSQYPAKSKDDLRVHFPDVRDAQWLDARRDGGLHHTAASRALPENQQLALYQWAAWNSTLGVGLHPDTDANIKAWNAAPAFVRLDPLMQ